MRYNNHKFQLILFFMVHSSEEIFHSLFLSQNKVFYYQRHVQRCSHNQLSVFGFSAYSVQNRCHQLELIYEL